MKSRRAAEVAASGGAEGGALCIRGVFTDANETVESRTFHVANELTARDTDTNGTANHSPMYDAVGNMTAEAFPSPPSSAPGGRTSRSGSSS